MIGYEKDINSQKSIYKFYQALLGLRKNSTALRRGMYENMTDDRSGCYIFKRTDENEEIWIICNFENTNAINIDISGQIILSNSGRKEIGGVYTPYECAIVKVK